MKKTRCKNQKKLPKIPNYEQQIKKKEAKENILTLTPRRRTCDTISNVGQLILGRMRLQLLLLGRWRLSSSHSPPSLPPSPDQVHKINTTLHHIPQKKPNNNHQKIIIKKNTHTQSATTSNQKHKNVQWHNTEIKEWSLEIQALDA